MLPKDTACPICGNTSWKRIPLVIHHWGPTTRLEAIRLGKYRRMCDSCNHLLRNVVFDGRLYTDDITWEEQWLYLCGRFSWDTTCYPNFDGVEKNWSKLTQKELVLVGRKSWMEVGG